MNAPIPEDKFAAIKQLVFQGQKIAAIKAYRECTQAGLAEAKKTVEKLEADLRKASPEKFTGTPDQGMNAPIPEDKFAAIKQLLFQGQKIEAIKAYRECTQMGLAAAKETVEKLEADLRKTSPEKFTGTPDQAKGCMGVMMFAALCVSAMGVIFWVVPKIAIMAK